jgi:hypothetical protein
VANRRPNLFLFCFFLKKVKFESLLKYDIIALRTV